MKMTLLTLPLIAILFADRVNAGPAVTLSSLKIGGIGSTLLIDAPAKITVTAIGNDGMPFIGTPTFTSSDPNVVNVSADGTLTVKHLNLKPVTLTAMENGKSATLNINTYGLDAAGGTYLTVDNMSAPGYSFILAFRDADNNPLINPSVFTIQGPVTFNHGAPIARPMNKGVTVQTYAWIRNQSVPVVSGTYTATGAVAGTTYSKTFKIDATQVQPIVSSVNVNFDAYRYTATGTLPSGSPLVYPALYLDDYYLGDVYGFENLPTNGRFYQPLVNGKYYMEVVAQNYHKRSDEAFPDQVNVSTNRLNTIMIFRPKIHDTK